MHIKLTTFSYRLYGRNIEDEINLTIENVRFISMSEMRNAALKEKYNFNRGGLQQCSYIDFGSSNYYEQFKIFLRSSHPISCLICLQEINIMKFNVKRQKLFITQPETKNILQTYRNYVELLYYVTVANISTKHSSLAERLPRTEKHSNEIF